MITGQILEKFLRLIEGHSGLSFRHEKLFSVSARIKEEAERLSVSPEDYYRMALGQKDVLEKLICMLANQETYFFRERPQLSAFGELLRRVKAGKQKKGEHSLRVLSAGCARGEEAYTLNIIIMESGHFLWGWDINVLGVDINRDSVDRAKKAVYTGNSLRPSKKNAEDISRYFDEDNNLYALKAPWRRNVSFMAGNLLEEKTYSGLGGAFDFVFCRNLFIYMPDEAIRKVSGYLYDCLTPGGYLFAGTSEPLNEKTQLFSPVRCCDSVFYIKARSGFKR
ncbi:MAG: methyltransferase domain-containing protein [Nitrospiraceae bacterium]|nr:methyltransferase domain-containing protein [Nitrospiraceae bacterium]